MKYIQLNNTELNISPICLGTAGFGDKSDLEKSFEILNAFVWAGGNFIDTANVYCKWLKGHGNCSEQIIGKWLKESGMQGKVIVATKGAHYSFEDPGRSRVNKEDIRMDLDESCRTLGKDEMDFYWLHRDDPEKPAEEIVDILEELKKEGLWFVCADMGGTNMYDLDLKGAIGLVIGNEGDGVSRVVREKCDFIASIPMKGDIDSLNASVAAGVLAFEIVRQRM